MKRLFAASCLLLAAGCDRMVNPGPAPVYAPWEEGLTLVFEDRTAPELPKSQLRVDKSTDTPQGKVVEETFTDLTGQWTNTFRLKDGMVVQRLDAQIELIRLPPGFPDHTMRWEDKGYVMSVVGRGRVDLPGVRLPDPDATGVWVEASHPSGLGARWRSLMVPDLGGVLTLSWNKGQWTVVNQLVSVGFTDLPKKGSTK
jgi:hypothetical protein